MHTHLEDIREGMKVVDSANHEIGKVELVRLSDEDPTTPEAEVVDASEIERSRNTIVDSIADVFDPAEFPEEIRERLLREGFIRLDTDGLFASDRYILPSQVAGIMNGMVMLNVKKDDLVKRH